MESEWVKTEIAKARKREVRDQRRVLFPIRLAPFETLRDWECFDADTGALERILIGVVILPVAAPDQRFEIVRLEAEMTV
jgi:hypothetical protein